MIVKKKKTLAFTWTMLHAVQPSGAFKKKSKNKRSQRVVIHKGERQQPLFHHTRSSVAQTTNAN
jgi:hypothetical protein